MLPSWRTAIRWVRRPEPASRPLDGQWLVLGSASITLGDSTVHRSKPLLQPEDLPQGPFDGVVLVAGDDEEQVRPFGDALRKRFGQVFDYRDGRSLRSGKPWGPQIEKELGDAGLAVVMLSPSYLEKKPSPERPPTPAIYCEKARWPSAFLLNSELRLSTTLACEANASAKF